MNPKLFDPVMFGVLIHHPGHHLRSGVNIRCGHVLLRADVLPQRVDVATAEALLLAHGHLLGVADDSAFAAAQGQAEKRTLPGHPGRESPHGVDGLIRMESNAALAGAQSIVVLNSKALEDLQAAVVHAYRDRYVELSPGVPEKLMHSGIQVQNLCTIGELFLGYLKGIRFGHFLHLRLASTQIFMFD